MAWAVRALSTALYPRQLSTPKYPQARLCPNPAARLSARATDSRLAPGDFPMADSADDRLRLLIERIERLEEEKKGIGDDIKDVYNEAKATGYDAKIMRQIVRLRKMKPDDRREMEAVLETYKNALGID
jgi:uncharacterized protein (UPF0335 family)